MSQTYKAWSISIFRYEIRIENYLGIRTRAIFGVEFIIGF